LESLIQETFIVISLALGAYVLGSVPTAYILVRWMEGEDIRDVGSRNVGALNAYNRTGAWAGLLVLVVDTEKGVLAVAAPRLLGVDASVLFITTPLVVAGHNWPVFLQFKGGRGILTALGGLALMVPVAAIFATATFLTVTALSRYISLGSVIGVMIGALAILALALAGMSSDTYMVYGFIACAMLVWQHRDNLQRIRDGNERRLGQPATKVE